MIYLFLGSAVLLIALFSGMLIGAAVGLSSLVAHAPLGLENVLSLANITAWKTSRSFTLTAVPLFIFMGEIAARSGLVMSLFNAFLLLTRGKIPGGLLQPVIFTSTIFAACSGSSTASAAALGSIIYPDLRRKNYPPSVSTGCLAAGGSLAMLLPPSIVLVIFGSLTDESIGALYLGAVVPGLIIALLFAVYAAVVIPRPSRLTSPEEEKREADKPIGKGEALRAFLSLASFLALMLTVLGPLYLGIATATEVASLGSAGAIILASVTQGKKVFQVISEAAMSAVKVTCMAYFILFGTMTFSMALASTGASARLPLLMNHIGNPHLGMLCIFLLYLIMGMIFDPISMLLLTTPFMVPILKALGFSVIWSGIFIALMIEIGLLTPPVGVNLFVLHGSTKVPFMKVAKGCIGFVAILVLAILLLYLFPGLVEWLPSRMVGR